MLFYQKEDFEIFKIESFNHPAFYSTTICLLLVQHGDIEINPRPRKKQPQYFSCCHGNVNSLLAHNKISQLTTYNTIYQHDTICLSEIFFDSSASLDDHNLSIQGYSLIQADHPDDVKRVVHACILNKI